MGNCSPQKLIQEVKRRVREGYGQTTLTKALQELDLENDVLSYAARTGIDDAEDIAGFYLEALHGQL